MIADFKINVLSLEQLRELPVCNDYDAGIYFLWRGEELLYIGQSKQISYRLLKHDEKRIIPYDRHTCIVLREDADTPPFLYHILDAYEAAYIAAYRPAFNSKGLSP